MNPGLLVITFEWKFLQMTHCAGTIGKPRALANAISTKPWLARHTICHRDARIKKIGKLTIPFLSLKQINIQFMSVVQSVKC